jgi:hypothetical protein
MTSRRARHAACAVVAAFAATPASALAPEAPLTAERAIESQKDMVREAVGTLPCRRDGTGADIVVCGRRGADPFRIPLPDQRLPGEPENLLPGELPRARSSYDTCAIACPRGAGIDVFKAIGTSIKIVRHILGKDD